MADANSQTSKTQTPTPEVSSQDANSSKHFIYKATVVAIFLVLLPLFPSQAPEFFTQSRSWEILQLIFVGIAVSYGLFSKKNDEAEKEFDNAQSYVSKLLQVSSVFDDESENHNVIDENKVENWNYSQYSRVESVVVVAKESPIEEKNFNLRISEKPLLLPVRSLKNRVPEKPGENVVLRSPIPWQSRSGRIEMKENEDGFTSYFLSPLMEDPELRSVEEARSLKLKSSENVVRKNNFSSPPPAPPPPPPAFLHKPVLVKSNSGVPVAEEVSENEKISGKSVRTFKKASEQIKGLEKDYVMNSVEKKGYSDTMMEEKTENVLVETRDDEDWEAEREEDYFEGSSGDGESGPDVDKKADEFIAKFREQIRQQRIELIRGSTADRARTTL